MVDFSDWPSVPEASRPRNLYVDQRLAVELQAELENRGWRIVDTRLLDGAEAVRGTLEGIRAGTIEPTRGDVKFLELEAKIHGLLSARGAEFEKPDKVLNEASLEELFAGFGEGKAQPEQWGAPESPEPVKRRGRPKGAKDKKPRATEGYQELRGAAAQVKES